MKPSGWADGVSRETSERLEIFETLLKRWNPKINLVSRASISELRERHFRDSIQLYSLAPSRGKWCDLGSGGGFPGIVVGILAAENPDPREVVLIESDQRKAAFLRAAVRETGIRCTVLSERIELAEPQNAAVLSARALADLGDLLAYSERHLGPDGVALFPKGVTWKKELETARRQWSFDCRANKSETEPDAAILAVKGVKRV